jgi:hypothetical protein
MQLEETSVYQETKKTHQVQRSFIITMYEREGLILLLWSGISLENSLEHKIYCSGRLSRKAGLSEQQQILEKQLQLILKTYRCFATPGEKN